MINTVVVTYEIKPASKDVHIGLINEVFEQLKLNNLKDVDYKVFCLNDGVTFTHISTFQSEDGSNPIVKLKAFQDFSKSLSDRVVSPPKVETVTLVGDYTEDIE